MHNVDDIALVVKAQSFELLDDAGNTIMTLAVDVPFTGFAGLEMHHLDPQVGDSILAWSVGDSGTDDQTTLLRGPIGPGFTASPELQFETHAGYQFAELSPGVANTPNSATATITAIVRRDNGAANVTLTAYDNPAASAIVSVNDDGVGNQYVTLAGDTIKRADPTGTVVDLIYAETMTTLTGSLASPIAGFANMVLFNFTTTIPNAVVEVSGAANFLCTGAGGVNLQARLALDGSPTTAVLDVEQSATAVAVGDRRNMTLSPVYLVVATPGAHVAGLQVAKGGGTATWSASGYASLCVRQ